MDLGPSLTNQLTSHLSPRPSLLRAGIPPPKMGCWGGLPDDLKDPPSSDILRLQMTLLHLHNKSQLNDYYH